MTEVEGKLIYALCDKVWGLSLSGAPNAHETFQQMSSPPVAGDIVFASAMIFWAKHDCRMLIGRFEEALANGDIHITLWNREPFRWENMGVHKLPDGIRQYAEPLFPTPPPAPEED